MHFVLQTPSLQHLAGLKVVSHLLTQHIFTQITPKLWKLTNIKDDLTAKVWALPLPPRCKERLVNLVKPLGTEILHWCKYLSEKSDSAQSADIFLPQHLRWSMHGTVDYAKMVELVLKDETLDLQNRFELACVNCLEDEARELFRRLTQERRATYLLKYRKRNYVNILRYANRPYFSQFILFFSRSINLDVRHELMWFAGVESLNNIKSLFEDALRIGNRAMCENLFRALSSEEKEQVLHDCRSLVIQCRTCPTDNLLYYLSLMNEEQQRRMFRKCKDVIFHRLLCWPLQSLFVAAAECGWQSMTDSTRSNVLLAIVSKIHAGSDDYDYSRLFLECWALSSVDFRRIYLDEFRNLDGLLRTKREELIRLVLNEAPWQQILELRNLHREMELLLMDESVISAAALLECKEKAALMSSNDADNEEKRLRSEQVSRLVVILLENRID